MNEEALKSHNACRDVQVDVSLYIEVEHRFKSKMFE